jgi:hypothetical protein
MTSLLTSLDAVVKHLSRLNRIVVDLLQPGLSVAEISTELSQRRLPMVQELSTLWTWRNGTASPPGLVLGDFYVVPGFYLLSMREAMVDYDAFIKSARWQASWVPVLANGGGDFLVLDVAEAPGKAMVRHFRIDESEHPIEYASMDDMFATFAAAYQRGAFYVGQSGYLEQDYDAYAAIAAKMNPQISWWRD